MQQATLVLFVQWFRETFPRVEEVREANRQVEYDFGQTQALEHHNADFNELLDKLIFYFILFYFISFYFILFYFILFYFILFHFISFYFISFHFISFYFILFYASTPNKREVVQRYVVQFPSLSIHTCCKDTLASILFRK